MSEPQHPQPHDDQANTGHPAPSASRAVVQPGISASPDSLAAAGVQLAQIRESKGWSIDDVSARLKVAPAKLRAIEEGDLGHLPDVTFALGVVRSYAKMLGVDPAAYSQALRREKGVVQQNLSLPASSGRDLPRGKVSLSLGGGGQKRRSWLWAVALVVVVLIVLGMWHTNGGDSSAWLARLKATAGGGTDTSSVTSGASGSVAQGEGAAPGAADESPAAPASEAQASAQTAPQTTASGVPMPAPLTMGAPSTAPAVTGTTTAVAPAAASRSAVVTSTSTSTSTQPSAAASPAAASTVTAAAGQAIVALRVTQDSWFSVRDKAGKEVFSGLVHAGDSKEVVGAAPLKVTVGNKAGLESMTLDGQPVDPAKYASARGNVARFALP